MITLSIPDMSCGHCKTTIEQTIKSLDPAATLDFDMPARTLDLQTVAPLQTVQIALNAAGYNATVT